MNEKELNQANLDYLIDNYWQCLALGILAVGDREKLELIRREDE